MRRAADAANRRAQLRVRRSVMRRTRRRAVMLCYALGRAFDTFVARRFRSLGDSRHVRVRRCIRRVARGHRENVDLFGFVERVARETQTRLF